MKKVSIKDVARLSGVSVATVSRVINENGRFSEKTKKKVLQVIKDIGYQTNYSAKSLRTNKSYSIGVLVPDISNYFFADVVQKIEEILFKSGYSTIICNTARNSEKEIAYLKILESKGVDGIIVISGASSKDNEFLFGDSKVEKNTPYICIDREPKEKNNTIFISSNHYMGAYMATESLIKSGSKFPVIVMHERQTPSAIERYKGFCDAIKNYHLSSDFINNKITINTEKACYLKKLQNYLKKNPQVDSIFAINDDIALNILISLKKLNVRVPQDIKLIGFDDTPQGKFSTPTLSSVKQDTKKISQIAVKSLFDIISNPNCPDKGSTKIIPTSLTIRESSM